MSSFTLDDAAFEDAPILTQLIVAAFEDQRGRIDPPSGAHHETPEKVLAKLAQGGGILAKRGDEAAGCVLYYPDDTGAMYLGRLAVLPAYRQHGLGQILVEAVEAKARAAGYNSVTLSVRVALPKNRAYFERMGYAFTSADYHPGYTEPTFVHMAKPLR